MRGWERGKGEREQLVRDSTGGQQSEGGLYLPQFILQGLHLGLQDSHSLPLRVCLLSYQLFPEIADLEEEKRSNETSNAIPQLTSNSNDRIPG